MQAINAVTRGSIAALCDESGQPAKRRSCFTYEFVSSEAYFDEHGAIAGRHYVLESNVTLARALDSLTFTSIAGDEAFHAIKVLAEDLGGAVPRQVAFWAIGWNGFDNNESRAKHAHETLTLLSKNTRKIRRIDPESEAQGDLQHWLSCAEFKILETPK
jgi:hypothetical protein